MIRVAVGQTPGAPYLLIEAASKSSLSQTVGGIHGIEPQQLNVAETGRVGIGDKSRTHGEKDWTKEEFCSHSLAGRSPCGLGLNTFLPIITPWHS